MVERGHLLGSAIYSTASQIRARLYSRTDTEFSRGLLVARIRDAYDRRQGMLPDESAYRLVHGESDGLPGLIIDRYETHFVMTTLTPGMESRQEMVLSVLRELFPVDSVFAANDTHLRLAEGLDRYRRLLFGSLPEVVTIRHQGAQYQVNIKEGQKTGFYFDQGPSRRRVRELARGRSVLDVFCYSGGFALSAMLGGAREALAIDSSDLACSAATRNAELNGFQDRVKVMQGDAFEILRRLRQEGYRCDLAIIDPPSLARASGDKRRAQAALRDINYQAMRLLRPKGLLLSCSCSHHIGWSDLLAALAQAAQGCGRTFLVRERIGAGPDHPVLLTMPESEYLRCYLLQVV